MNSNNQLQINEPLCIAIRSYGVGNLIEKGHSKSMVYAVLSGRRKFSHDEKARDVADILGIDKSVVRPDVWGD